MADLKKGDLAKFLKNAEASGFVQVWRRGSIYGVSSNLDPHGFNFNIKQSTDNLGYQKISISTDRWDNGDYHWKSYSMEKLRENLRDNLLLELDTMVDRW